MSKVNKKVYEVKNKKGNVIQRVMEIEPKTKNSKISIKEVNNVYKKLIQQQDPNNFMIKVMTIDGMKTLKSFDFVDEDLKYALENYYSSLPKEAQEKFYSFESVQFIIR